ncbi:hypothetical protein BDN72DRAFT_881847 [Pluteus cervinus]|uniref:Uncharacterized protein n=1 Tax=Pluteus cervinus TaxID=181527 RepID=A0ACD3ADB0_9AGAR|nr:hypothetical protein BDN72DRAFT_881847 [Pluteus cervinus]
MAPKRKRKVLTRTKTSPASVSRTTGTYSTRESMRTRRVKSEELELEVGMDQSGDESQDDGQYEEEEERYNPKPTLKRGRSGSMANVKAETPKKRIKVEHNDDSATVKEEEKLVSRIKVKYNGNEESESEAEEEEEERRANRIKTEEDNNVEIKSESESDGEEDDEGNGTCGSGSDTEEVTRATPKYILPSTRALASSYGPGRIIEHGHIYFFYRPKVQLQTAKDMDEVKIFQMLLLPDKPPLPPTPPSSQNSNPSNYEENAERKYRILTIGHKYLPPWVPPATRGEAYWAPVSSLGEDLRELEDELTAYQSASGSNAPARLAARGVYMLVNTIPQRRPETYLAFYLSHPNCNSPSTKSEPDGKTGASTMGPVHQAFGLTDPAMSFQIRIKKPSAGPNANGQVNPDSVADYPEKLISRVFGRYSFAHCATLELLDYVDTQILVISPNVGVNGIGIDIGPYRAKALQRMAEAEGEKLDGEDVLRELGLDECGVRLEALQGKWV